MLLSKSDGLPRAFMAHGVVVVAWALALSASAGEKTLIGEKIQFSGAGDTVQLPSYNPGDKIASKPFEFLDRNNSISGVVGPLALPAPGSFPSLPGNQKLREMFERKLDEKKNWIYRTPSDLSRLATVNEMFGVRDTETDGRSPKSRKSVERFFDEQKAKPTADTAGDDWLKRNGDKKQDYSFGPDKRRDNDIGSSYTQPVDPGRMMTAGFSLPPDWSESTGAQKPLNDTSGFRSDRANSAREQLGQTDNFRRLLATPGINPLAAGFDPINLRVGTTGQEFNPLAPILPTEIAPPSLAGALSGTDNRAVAGRLNPLAEQGTKTLGTSSLSPAISAPPEPSYLKPKPTTTELPRRKF